jgi:plasmid stabilization system protein ParE
MRTLMLRIPAMAARRKERRRCRDLWARRRAALIFYVAHEHTVDILRVAQAHRDIPARLQSDV